MKRKSASELFHEVDPELNVIEARHYPRDRRKKRVKLSEQPKPEASHYVTHRATEEDWGAAAGVNCPKCGRETLQLINGMCPQCAREVEIETDRQIENRAMKNYYQDKRRRGTLNLRRMRKGLP